MEWISKQLKEKQEKETKMRWIRGFKRKNYFTETKISDCKQILRIRLHMVRAKCYYKGSFKELKCKKFCKCEETTEHLLECTEYRKSLGYTWKVSDLYNKENKKALLEAARYMREIEEYKLKTEE